MSEFDFNENHTVREDTSTAAQETMTSFQDELRKNMRSKEDVKKEYEERIRKAKEQEKKEMEAEAMLTLQKVKGMLLQNVKAASYTMKNGVTTVSCLCDAPSRFLSHRPRNNSMELERNNRSFILLRDPTMHYQIWDEFYITPAYTQEYDLYSDALKRLAGEENISIEFVICNVSRGGTSECPFPSNSKNIHISKGKLCIRACTVISTEQSSDRTHAAINEAEHEDETATEDNEQITTHKKEMSVYGFIIYVLIILIFAAISLVCLCTDKTGLGYMFILIYLAMAAYLVLR